jgi:transposase
MNVAGINVSSRKSTVAILRPFGEVVRLPFDVTHDAEGLAFLATQLKALDGETHVVMEHTGRYYESVAKALHELCFSIFPDVNHFL